jgi:hypothetical protein
VVSFVVAILQDGRYNSGMEQWGLLTPNERRINNNDTVMSNVYMMRSSSCVIHTTGFFDCLVGCK